MSHGQYGGKGVAAVHRAKLHHQWDVAPGGGGSSGTLVFKYNQGDSTAGYTFSRALAAYQTGSGGVLTSIASGTIRDAHYIGGTKYTLLEPARTNLVLQSKDISNAAWSKINGAGGTTPTVTSNVYTDPTGAATAATRTFLAPNTVAGAYAKVRQIPASQPAVIQTYSMYLIGAAGNSGGANVYIQAAETSNWFDSLITPSTSVWAQYQLQTGSAGGYSVGFGSDLRSPNESSYTGNWYFGGWGGQLESGSYATSPIDTGASAVARPADVLTLTVSGGSGQVGTLYEKYYDLATATTVEQVSPYTTSSTYVPQTGRAWLSWKFVTGTQTLSYMQAQ